MITEILKKAIKFILIYFIIAGCLTYLASLICGIDLIDAKFERANLQQTLIITTLELIGTLLSIVVYTKYVDKIRPSYIVLQIKSTKDIFKGFLMGLLIMISGFLFLLLFRQISNISFSINTINILTAIAVFIAVAIMEEVLVRGFVLEKLLHKFPPLTALLLSSLIFSALHLLNPNMNLLSFINLILAGILLGLPYMLKRNLWFSISLHFSWNLFQSILGFNVSGKNYYSVILQGRIEDNIWTGASFGFEGSIICLIFQLIAIVVILITNSNDVKAIFQPEKRPFFTQLVKESLN